MRMINPRCSSPCAAVIGVFCLLILSGCLSPLWKDRPVVTAKAAGIPMQFPEPFHKNLVESVEGYAARVLDLLTRPGERGKFDRPGRGVDM
jgi:hypothetical protein